MKRDVIEKIEDLASEEGFLYSLAWILLRDLFFDPEQAADVDWRSRLSHQELSFLVGLMVKRPISMRAIDEKTSQAHVAKTYRYFQELQEAFVKPAMEHLLKTAKERSGSPADHEQFRSVFGTGDAMAECVFYSDSGAYDFQYLDFAGKRYRKDREWLEKRRGFPIEAAVGIFKKLKGLHAKKYAEAPRPRNFDEFSKMALSVFCFVEEDLNEFDRQEARNVLGAFSTKPGAVNKTLSLPGEYNVINSHPIVILDGELYFVPVLFNLAQSIYESPFYWMLNDPKYRDASLKNRGDATVEIASELLANAFGRGNVCKGVVVKKSRSATLTDIDLLAVTGNKAVICQTKSKKLTALSRTGDEEKLKQDFSDAIQESYDQAKICRTAILQKGNRLVTADGQEVRLDDSIDDVYILCITSDHYPAITFQTKTLLRKNAEDPNPIAINIFDLDILAYYLSDPFEFLYYLKQRIALHDVFMASSEIDLLAYHLNQKLYSRKDDKSGKRYDVVVIDHMGQLIDAHFPSARGYHPKTKAMEKLHAKWSNPEFQEIINQLKASKQPGFTDAIFYLYDMEGEGGDQFVDAVRMLRRKCMRERKSLRFHMVSQEDKSGISYICDYQSDGKLFRHVMEYCQVKKYQTKSDMWLGLGGLATGAHHFVTVTFSKSPWKHDPQLEQVAKTHFTKSRVKSLTTGRELGRNDPCYCGSRIKYKKCHGREH